MSEKHSNYDKYYEDAYNNSIANGDVKKSSMLSKKLTALFIAASILVVAGTSVFLWNKINKHAKIDDYLRESDYYSYIENNHWSNGNTEGYDHVDLANSIENSDNPDLALYTFYNHLTGKYVDKKVIINNMDEVIKRMDFNGDGVVDFSSHDEYLGSKGFVGNNGEPSVDEYNNAMEKIILNNVENTEIKEKHGLGGKN